MSEAAAEAAEKYDVRNHSYVDATRSELATLKHDCESIVHDHLYKLCVVEVMRNRLFFNERPVDPPPHPVQGKPRPPKPKRRAPPWRLHESVWQPRQTTGNSKDYFETDASLRRTFDADWGGAQRGHGLDRAIVRAARPGGGGKEELRAAERKAAAADSQGIEHPAVEAVGNVLWKYARTLYGAFDYCALALRGGVELSCGTPAYSRPHPKRSLARASPCLSSLPLLNTPAFYIPCSAGSAVLSLCPRCAG